MKKIIFAAIALAATLLLASPVLAASKSERFNSFDLNQDGTLTFQELTSKGCKLKRGIFNYSDQNHDGVLTIKEYIRHYDLLKRCR